jgi:integrase
MGTVYARGSVLWIGFAGADGRWHYKSSGCVVGEETKARVRLDAIEEEIRKGNRAAELGPLSVAEWGARWQEQRLKQVPKLWNAAHEWKAIERHVLPAMVDEGKRFGRLRLLDVRPRHALALIRALRTTGLAPRSVANIWGTAHKLFADAVVQELLIGNPMVLPDNEYPRRVDADKTWRKTAVFSRVEAEQLIAHDDIDEDHRVAYALSLLGGLREGEVGDRRWRDYDADAEPLGRLSVHSSYTRHNKAEKGTKTDAPREVPVHPELAAILARWKLAGWAKTFGRKPGPDDFIVPNRRGRHLNDNNIRKSMQKDLALLGMRWRRYHDMRRTFVSLALADGALQPVLKRVTHSGIGDIVDQYNTPPWEALCAAVSCLRLGKKPHYSRSYKHRKSGG